MDIASKDDPQRDTGLVRELGLAAIGSSAARAPGVEVEVAAAQRVGARLSARLDNAAWRAFADLAARADEREIRSWLRGCIPEFESHVLDQLNGADGQQTSTDFASEQTRVADPSSEAGIEANAVGTIVANDQGGAPIAQAYVSNTSPAVRVSASWRWLARSQREPEPVDLTCHREGCASSGASEFDLYCKENGHLLALSDRPFVQHLFVNALRALFGFLALLAASRSSVAPVYVAAGVAAALLLGPPLHRHASAWRVALVGWAVVFALVVLDGEGVTSGRFSRAVLTVSLVVLLASLVGAVAGPPRKLMDSGDDDWELETHAIEASLVAGVVILAAWLLALSPLDAHFVQTSGSLRGGLLLIGVGFILGSIGVAAAAGLITGIRTADRAVKIPSRLEDPRPFKPRKRSRPDDPPRPEFGRRAFLDRLAFAVVLFLARTVKRLVDIYNAVLWTVTRAAYLALRTGFRGARMIYVAVVRTHRAIVEAVLETGDRLRCAASRAWRPTVRWGKSVLVPVLALLSCAALCFEAAGHFSRYLHSGGVADVALAIGCGAVAALITPTIWWALTGASRQVVASASGRLLNDAGPSVLLVALAIGWVDGLLGLLGVGSLRPGWLTIGGTLVIAAAAAYNYWSQRARNPSRTQLDAS